MLYKAPCVRGTIYTTVFSNLGSGDLSTISSDHPCVITHKTALNLIWAQSRLGDRRWKGFVSVLLVQFQAPLISILSFFFPLSFSPLSLSFPSHLLPAKLVSSVSGAPSCQSQVRHWIQWGKVVFTVLVGSSLHIFFFQMRYL